MGRLRDRACPQHSYSQQSCFFLYHGFSKFQDSASLGKDRFGHAPDAAGIGLLCWVFQESAHDIVWTSAGESMDSVAHSRKQEEVALTQCLGCQHPVRWRCYRIIFALQDQRRNGTGDRLLLYRGDRFHPPELTGRGQGQANIEQSRPDL